MALTKALFANDDPTPESVKRRRALAEQLLGGKSPTNITHPMQVLAEVLEGGIGGWQSGKADQEERAIGDRRNKASLDIYDHFAGQGGSALSGISAPSAPAPGGAGTAAAPTAGSTIDFASAGRPGELDGYLSNIRTAESGGNDQAKNPRSSATGRYQFIDSTWNDLTTKYPGLGLTPDGRNDPKQQEVAIRAFTQDNAKALSAAGVPTTGGNLYAAHFLGARDAQKVLTGDPAASISAYVSPNVIKANPFLQGMSVGDFSKWAASKGGADAIAFGDTPAPAASTPVQVASLDPSVGIAQATAPAPPASTAAPRTSGVDPYGAIPATDSRGEDQLSKFRQWNSDPIANNEANLASIDPGMRQVIQRAKEIAGTDFVIGSGRRDADMQKRAVEWGWSQTEDSDHLGGGAVDLWPINEQGQVVFEPGRQSRIANAMKLAADELGIDIERGADWKGFKDMPHFALQFQTPMEAPIPTARPGAGGTQVASLDPSAGLAQATAPQQSLENLAVGQSMTMPQAVPQAAPQAMPQARAPSPMMSASAMGPQMLATPAEESQPDRNVHLAQALLGRQAPLAASQAVPQSPSQPQPQQLAQALMGGQSAPAPQSGEMRAVIAKLLSDPATEDIGQQLISQTLTRAMKPVEPIEINGRLVNPQTGAVMADFSDPDTSVVEGRVVNTRTGEVIYEAPRAPVNLSQGNMLVDPTSGQPIAQNPAAPKAPSVETLYDEATGQEYKAQWNPQTQAFERVGGTKAEKSDNGITIGPDGTVQIGGSGGGKMPAGFMADPNDPGRIMPMPGGPGEQISGELAARVGVADEFLTRAPAVRERLATGEASGPWDVFQARNNQSSPQAEVHRELEYGVEALVRMLTGAGMNMSEANERARRYLPTYTDDSTSMTSKLDGLVDYLRSTKEMAMRGRGGKPEDAPAGAPGGAPGGTVDYRSKYGLE